MLVDAQLLPVFYGNHVVCLNSFCRRADVLLQALNSFQVAEAGSGSLPGGHSPRGIAALHRTFLVIKIIRHVSAASLVESVALTLLQPLQRISVVYCQHVYIDGGGGNVYLVAVLPAYGIGVSWQLAVASCGQVPNGYHSRSNACLEETVAILRSEEDVRAKLRFVALLLALTHVLREQTTVMLPTVACLSEGTLFCARSTPLDRPQAALNH